MLESVLLISGGLVAGLVVALKVIAPRTKATWDDALLALLEKALPFLPKDDKAEAEKVLSARK